MIVPRHVLEKIRAGTVTLAFRRWRRPTVRAGGTLLTALGQLQILAVTRVSAGGITEVDAGRAGFSSRAALLDDLQHRTGEIVRIELGSLVPDPRLSLRASLPDAAGLTDLRKRLRRLDATAPGGPWTLEVLEMVRANPGVRAADLCSLASMPKDPFKRNVRKLKNLGLTESLETGYRLSPRGEAVLAALRHDR